jgi:hypothetical protein
MITESVTSLKEFKNLISSMITKDYDSSSDKTTINEIIGSVNLRLIPPLLEEDYSLLL